MGRLFAVYNAPADPISADRPAVLYLPPFAEEMNRSRRMASLMAQRLAARGVACLILDPFGTGDSEGDFADARWETWCADAVAAVDWLHRQGHARISPLGLRLGVGLALHAAAERPDGVAAIVGWQPVTTGDVFLNQFLRVRVAAGLDGEDRETTKDLKARLAGGEVLEIGGYELAPAMAAAITDFRLVDLAPSTATPFTWFHVGPDAEADIPPGSAKVIEAWRAADRSVTTQTVAGEPFWSIEETTLVPPLLSATESALTEGAA